MEKQSYRDRLVSLDKASVDTVEEFCKKHNMSVVIRGKNIIDNITGFAQLRLSATEDKDERPYLKCVLRACFSLIGLRDTVDYKILQLTEEIERLKKTSPLLTKIKPAERVFTIKVSLSTNYTGFTDFPISIYTLNKNINEGLPKELVEHSIQKIKDAFEKHDYKVLSIIEVMDEELVDEFGKTHLIPSQNKDTLIIEVRVEEPLEKTIKDITKKYQEDKSAQLHTLTARLEQMRRSKK